MPESSRQNLSEISHLFLTSIRQRQGGPGARPVRRPPQSHSSASMPPQAPSLSPAIEQSNADACDVALSPEEIASVTDMLDSKATSRQEPEAQRDAGRVVPVTAVIAAHLGASQVDLVRRYARHLCSAGAGARIGLIEIDAGAFHLRCFEAGAPATADVAEPHGTEYLEPRHINEAIEELNCDVDRWLLLTPAPRTPEARGLLRLVGQWTLLTETDHDGIVACYRTLKGLADLGRPALHLAALDSDQQHAAGILHKLSGVCQEFLAWPTGEGECVSDSQDVAEHLVMSWKPTQDKAQLASTAHWDAVAAFIERSARQQAEDMPPAVTPARKPIRATGFQPVTEKIHRRDARAAAVQAAPVQASVPDMVIPTPAPAPAAQQPALRMTTDTTAAEPTQVVDLPAGDLSEPSILAAVVHGDTSLVELPVQPPMCPSAKLAVDRQRRIILLAVARRGLSDLRAIGQAYHWMNENRALIAMAVPQLSIDAHALPRLTLLVDHNDLSAAVLQPMFESTAVTVQAYRTLRWGPKMGLLLEAA